MQSRATLAISSSWWRGSGGYPSLDEACVRIREFVLDADIHALAGE